MIITVAKPLSVVSNGILVDTRENSEGTRTFHWKMDQPHSTYLITVAAADFEVKGGGRDPVYAVERAVLTITREKAAGDG